MAQKSGYVVLSGEQVYPEEIETPASGYFEIFITNDSLEVEGEFKNLKDTYGSAGIFYGKKGEAGNQLFRLKVVPNEKSTGGTIKRNENRFAIRPSIKQFLKNGEIYIAISSDAHPHGELRGQIKYIDWIGRKYLVGKFWGGHGIVS